MRKINMYPQVLLKKSWLFFFFFIISLQLFEKLCLRLHNIRSITTALGAEPLTLGLGSERHAREVKPFDGTEVVVAQDHLSVGDLVAETVRRFVRIYCQFFVSRGRLLALLRLSWLPLLLLARSGGGLLVRRRCRVGAWQRCHWLGRGWRLRCRCRLDEEWGVLSTPPWPLALPLSRVGFP